MNTLLFFALPVATIILAIVFERIINSPILVALTAFAIYLVVTFTAFDESFLIFAIVYAILAYVVAFLSDYISGLINNNSCNCNNSECDNCNCDNRCTCNDNNSCTRNNDMGCNSNNEMGCICNKTIEQDSDINNQQELINSRFCRRRYKSI